MARFTVSMRETVSYKFEIEIPDEEVDGLDDNELEELIDARAEDVFVNEGPKPEWFDSCEDRIVDSFLRVL